MQLFRLKPAGRDNHGKIDLLVLAANGEEALYKASGRYGTLFYIYEVLANYTDGLFGVPQL